MYTIKVKRKSHKFTRVIEEQVQTPRISQDQQVNDTIQHINPIELMKNQNKIHTIISGLSTKLCKNNCKVNTKKIMRDVKKVCQENNTLLYLSEKIPISHNL